MNIDFKITTWERVHINDEDKEAVIEAVKNGMIQHSGDLFHLFPNSTIEKLQDCDEYLYPEENGGCPTLEVFDEEMEVIFRNGEKEI